MPKNNLLDVRKRESAGEHREPLLGSSNEIGALALQPLPSRRHSSITRPQSQGLPRTPRTPNRVRFDIQERKSGGGGSRSSSEHGLRDEASDRVDEEDYFTHHNSAARESHQRAPLLTDVEAPSVTVVNTDRNSQLEDLLENPRPKSGMMSAFMNMANSIM